MTNQKTKELIFSMLKENTGRAMGDSGGAYGRHWENNAKKTMKDFESEPEVYLDYTAPCQSDGVGITVSLFHYLPTVLELDEVCEEFNALPVKDWESETYGVSKAGEKWLAKKGLTMSDSWNSYNGESNLSQTIQGTNVGIGGSERGDYVLLQVHGGCDVRGGYTDAKLFKYQSFQEFIDTTPYILAELTRSGKLGDDKTISLDMREGGYGFTNEEGEVVPVFEGDTITASLS